MKDLYYTTIVSSPGCVVIKCVGCSSGIYVLPVSTFHVVTSGRVEHGDPQVLVHQLPDRPAVNLQDRQTDSRTDQRGLEVKALRREGRQKMD